LEETVKRIAESLAANIKAERSWKAVEREFRARDKEMKVTLPKLKCLEDAA
jgi:predicted AAA+ superfamily ATPase